ncbi:MAG: tetratricopeptide repeat protein, partial [Vicinamibacteria bacterium]
MILCALALAFTASEAAQKKEEPLSKRDAQKLVREGDKLYKKGEIDEIKKAGGYYLRVLQDFPEMGDVHFKLARIYGDLEEWENAAATYQKAADNSGGDDQLEAYTNLTEIYLRVGKYQEAAMSAPKVIEGDPSNSDAHIALAMSLAKTGQYEEAVVAAEKAVSLAPDSAIAQASLGMAKLGTGDQDAAEAAFTKALAVDASLAEAHAGMADIMLSKEDYDGAVA